MVQAGPSYPCAGPSAHGEFPQKLWNMCLIPQHSTYHFCDLDVDVASQAPLLMHAWDVTSSGVV